MSATLASLRIRNLALVEDVLWEPRPGFTAITGETGAGKSVILGALTLLLGERADKSLIRTGADTCSVEAVFEDAADPALAAILEEHGAEPCEDGRLLVKRTLPAEGNGRQFVNGSACTLALLRALGEMLVDLHGPHDHQSLFSRDHQTRLLDQFAASEDLRVEFSEARRSLLRLQEEKNAILSGEQALARELDLLTHQTSEIESAGIQPGEEDTLLARQRAAANSQRIGELCGQLSAGVSEDESSLTSRLGDLSRLTRELSRLDPAAEPIAAACEVAFSAADDLARAVSHYSSALDSGPANLAEIESRLDVLQTLKRKYGPTVDAVLAFHADAAEKLATLRARTERRDTLDADIAAAEKTVVARGKKLTTARTAAAKKLSERVRDGLKDLGFAKSEFFVALETHEVPVGHGFETAEFQFSPNPGETARPLRSIASSGEISRVMLALKGALADQDGVPVLIFDEIDANVGGEIAAKVGQKMRELGRSRQVLCITHLPQVAAFAAGQFVVSKEVKDNRTRTQLNETIGSSREEEIARMLGGKSDSAIAHARALLATK
jgi:DNA repair protein RecN (Recombination protein N)